MSDIPIQRTNGLDRTNAIMAGVVFLVSFVVYAMTVQRSFSFWDCGEFIAASVIMGIPHPPGTPFLLLLNRVFSLVPFVDDISYRVNYVSVISSAFTAMFSYLLTVKLARYFFSDDQNTLNRAIIYASGVIGGLFVAFSSTNWGNSVEAEAYGLALALSVAIVWLAIRFHEDRGTAQATVWLILAMFLAMIGLGVHMTVFLVVPACAVFFVLKKEAGWKDYAAICVFAVVELLLVMVFADGRGGPRMFYLVSAALGATLLLMLFRKINWAVLIAVGTCSTVMMAFGLYFVMAPIGIAAIVGLALLSRRLGWDFQWRSGLAIMAVGVIGISVNIYAPIRSAHNPRIDENHTSRDFRTFVDFLDRKQYGQESMIDRMFVRRGAWENQFGRHANMGFWSYFETQYSRWSGWGFAPFLILGLLGMAVAIRKRIELGVPFLTLFILCSIGLVLYMNFADGTKYSFQTGDAYLEVRNRDYFFTPAFVFFGIAMGLGAAAIMQWIKSRLEGHSLQKAAVYSSLILVLAPGITLAHNYHPNDRSKNLLPYWYAKNLLDSCQPNAILFTSGDNDTFPVWCLQEVYNYRKDIRVVNLSLLNTDWYVEQMKKNYGVPISLTDEQIVWKPFEIADGVWAARPVKTFHDRPRGRNAYLVSADWNGQTVRTSDMMTDEIVIENKFKDPIYFSAPPNANSPLKLREKAVHAGQVYRLERNPDPRLIDLEKGYDLFMNLYRFDGYESSEVFRDENATGVGLGVIIASGRIYEELTYLGDTARAEALCRHLIDVYPEYFQPYLDLAEIADKRGRPDSTQVLLKRLSDTLSAFLESNPSNQYYLQDLGAVRFDIGRATNNRALIDEGIRLSWEGFEVDPNANYAFRKLVSLLGQDNKWTEVQRAARIHAQYRRNLVDDLLQRILGISAPQGTPIQPGPGE